jgi:autotransporter passenger strand-loop-strand repeat protein
MISGGQEVVSSGGIASGATIDIGSQLISGGAAVGTTITGPGVEAVFSGGVASVATVGSSGVVIVSAGGATLGDAIIDSGFQQIWSGGAARATTISRGGTLSVLSGGVASGTMISGGCVGRRDGTVYDNLVRRRAVQCRRHRWHNDQRRL